MAPHGVLVTEIVSYSHCWSQERWLKAWLVKRVIFFNKSWRRRSRIWGYCIIGNCYCIWLGNVTAIRMSFDVTVRLHTWVNCKVHFWMRQRGIFFLCALRWTTSVICYAFARILIFLSWILIICYAIARILVFLSFCVFLSFLNVNVTWIVLLFLLTPIALFIFLYRYGYYFCFSPLSFKFLVATDFCMLSNFREPLYQNLWIHAAYNCHFGLQRVYFRLQNTWESEYSCPLAANSQKTFRLSVYFLQKGFPKLPSISLKAFITFLLHPWQQLADTFNSIFWNKFNANLFQLICSGQVKIESKRN